MDRWLEDETILRFSDIESKEHLMYVEEYTRILATCYAKQYPKARMTQKKIEYIVKASRYHDIGKIAIPDWILLKDGRLSVGEMEILRTHTIKGCEMFHVMGMTEDEDYNRICHNVILYHHEKYDGTGYPYGLRKDKIPKEAQLVGLADMYAVLVHGIGERKKFTKEEAFSMLLQDEFGEISPRLKECLTIAKEEMENYVVLKEKD